MDDENERGGWYREKVGRKIELGMNRMIGSVLALIGVWAFYVSLTAETFTLATHWFGLVVGAVLLFLARLCFKATKSIIEGFGEEPDGTPARRKPRQ